MGDWLVRKWQNLHSKIITEGDTIQVGMTKLVFKWNSKNINEIEQNVENSDFVGTIVINI